MLTYIAIKEGSNWYGMFYLFISKLSSWGTSAFSNLVGGSKNGCEKKSLKALVLSILRSYFALHLARLLVPSLVCSESCTIGSCSKAVDSLKDESTFSIRGILLMKDLRGAAGYQKKKRRTEFTRWMILRRFQAAKRLWKMNVIAVSFACVLIIRQKRLDSSSNPRILFISSKGSDFSGSSKWA